MFLCNAMNRLVDAVALALLWMTLEAGSLDVCESVVRESGRADAEKADLRKPRSIGETSEE